ncbi:alpha/beta hydrolase [Leptolyngbya cf. ectocarpi LEGE 11479]|uniref:Alpha/beta hydrolase n=1 Tax=Leptolyngbya cf. ectocarpi LEGE 11479 TaxID=1828722 RepID=A0A928X489_LEPEC|nr:alpha/beta hydrolase [Leptolyngbya ectocarpi]MBE9067339.1 alpha/beta hydrolase [Leptolyngbya cf. ectocarpi LEGE 11479]
MFSNFQTHTIQTADTHIHTLIGGSGPPLLLLHGYPQTHVMWHLIAPRLAQHFTVVCSDLRGYGDSGHPPTDAEHAVYAKRTVAQDQIEMMAALGFDTFMAAGHDRGGRVLHRLLLDHPTRVTRAALLDIVPTRHIFQTIDQSMASIYEHWFFLIQPDRLPERLIGYDPDFYLTTKLNRWSASTNAFKPEAMAEYLRCFRRPETIHSTCEDYRAAATIDLAHDETDLGNKIRCPLLVLWGAYGAIEKHYDVVSIWQRYATLVEGKALPCGHFLPEEAPEQTYHALMNFFKK